MDQQRLAAGPLEEYSQFGKGIPFGDATPRAGNDSGGGQPGQGAQMQGLGNRPERFTRTLSPKPRVGRICELIGKPEWTSDPDYATPAARLPRLDEIFDAIEEWTSSKTKFEVMEICNPLDIPVGPILSMKEISEDEGLRATGTIVEVDHPERGAYVSVGCPFKFSDHQPEVRRSPLLGEHTMEVLTDVLGYGGRNWTGS